MSISAKAKLLVEGSACLVLEEDGTEIDEDEALQEMSNKTLMLLMQGQEWQPPPPANMHLVAEDGTVTTLPVMEVTDSDLPELQPYKNKQRHQMLEKRRQMLEGKKYYHYFVITFSQMFLFHKISNNSFQTTFPYIVAK